MLAPWKERYDGRRWYIKKQKHHFADQGPHSQSGDFSTSHVWIWELDHEESWVLKNWCFQIVVLEKTLESPLDCKKIKVNSKWNQPWVFIGRTDAEAETTILWPPDAKKQLIGKDPDDGRLSSGEQGDKGWDGWMASLTSDMSLSRLREMVKDKEALHAAVHEVTKRSKSCHKGHDWMTEQQKLISTITWSH